MSEGIPKRVGSRIGERPRLPVRYLAAGDDVEVFLSARGHGPGRPRRRLATVVRVYADAGRALVQFADTQKRSIVKEGEFDALAAPLGFEQIKALAAALEAYGEAVARKTLRGNV